MLVCKKGLKYAAENYRPISLTSVCCKILEHIIARNIMQHAEKKTILYPLQHGFRKGRSCETQHTGETLAVRQSAGTSPVSKDFV
jgi:hypothetical protein